MSFVNLSPPDNALSICGANLSVEEQAVLHSLFGAPLSGQECSREPDIALLALHFIEDCNMFKLFLSQALRSGSFVIVLLDDSIAKASKMAGDPTRMHARLSCTQVIASIRSYPDRCIAVSGIIAMQGWTRFLHERLLRTDDSRGYVLSDTGGYEFKSANQIDAIINRQPTLTYLTTES